MVAPHQTNLDTPPTLVVVPWPDSVVEAHGHRPGSPYIHAVWLGALGPSTTLCWERLARIATVRDNASIDTADLAVSLGLGGGMGRNAPISRTLGRMVAFGTAVREGDTLAVRRALPDVPARMTGRLSHSARMAHEQWAKLTMPTPCAPAPVPSMEVGL